MRVKNSHGTANGSRSGLRVNMFFFNILNICATLFQMLHHCMTCNVSQYLQKMLLTSNHFL